MSHMLCGNVLNTNLRLDYFLSNNQIFYHSMLRVEKDRSVSKERNYYKIVTKYIQWPMVSKIPSPEIKLYN